MKKKILILGANGMAGHVITLYFRKLKDNFEVLSVARNNSIIKPDLLFDISEFKVLGETISSYKPDYIINCIGILNQDAEVNPANAILMNSYLPHFLEIYTTNTYTKIIHISTDCVFSGSKGGYRENDYKDGKGFYAQSKSLGELINDKDITLRTSIIGPELNTNGIGLFQWFMNQPKNTLIKGYSHAFWSGITTIELAKVIRDVIEKGTVGIKHISVSKKTSKLELLRLFNEVFKDNNLTIIIDDNYQVDKSLISTRIDYHYEVLAYKDMVLEMKNWIINQEIYHY